MINICLFGAGLIGSVHAGNLARHPKVRFRYIVDPRREAAERIAAMSGAEIVDAVTALDDPTLDAVMIASATRTHADLAMAAATSGKAIFCEKPIDLDIGRTDACLAAVAKAGVIFQIGFNRRFDPSFHALKQRLDSGEIAAVEQVIITSRDPEPETEEALASGGGVFREMTIHDFDMARHLLGEEPVEMFATGSSLVSPAYAKLGALRHRHVRAPHRLGPAVPHQQQRAGELRLRPANRSARIGRHVERRKPQADLGRALQCEVRVSRQAAVLLRRTLRQILRRRTRPFRHLHRDARKAVRRSGGRPSRDDPV